MGSSIRWLTYGIILTPVLAVVAAWVFRRRPSLLNLCTIVFSFISLLASLLLADKVLKTSKSFFDFDFIPYVALYLDSLSIYFVLLVNLVAFITSIYAIPFLNYDQQHNRYHNPAYFHAFLNLFHLTMLIVPMVDNLVILWIAVELTTIFSTLLVHYQRSRWAVEASWKFLIITTTGIIFALLGTLFLINAIPVTNEQSVMRWSVMLKDVNRLDKNWVMLSFLFILIGYGTKAGLAPMHTWLPDGHGEAPSPVSALLSGVMLKSALYAILRFYVITHLVFSPVFTSMLLILAGLFSLILATPFILKKNKFKRILAYHSLEHMGIITFGIGIGTSAALFGALLHVLNHALTKALMFLVYGNIQYAHSKHLESSSANEEEQISGVLKSMPLYGTFLGLGGLALVGSPPFSIFMSKLMILWSAIREVLNPTTISVPRGILIGAVVLFAVTVTMIFGGLVSHVSRVLLGKPLIDSDKSALSWCSIALVIPFVFLTFMLIVFGICVPNWPIDFPQLLNNCVKILQQGSVNG